MKYLILLMLLFVIHNKVILRIPVNGYSDITFTMTTCNRLDLTLTTLSSLKGHGYNFDKFIIMIDCFNETFADILQDKYADVHFVTPTSRHVRNKNRRQMDNLQQLFEMVSTPWWFHCEDDWEFLSPGFVEASKAVLSDPTTDRSIYMMMGREPNSFKPFVNKTFGWTTNSPEYGVLNINSGPAGRFASYTANPAIINMSRARSMIGNFSNFRGEFDVSEKLGKRYGARVGIFKEHYYKHIGAGRTTMGGLKST